MPSITIRGSDTYDFEATYDKYGDGNEHRVFHKIDTIKAIRLLTGLSLKDAKNFVDCATVSPQAQATSEIHSQDPHQVEDAKRALTANGFVFTVTEDRCPQDLLKEAAVVAIEQNDIQLAHQILICLISTGEY